MSTHLIERYWEGVQRRLQAEIEGFNSLISHQGVKGVENELALARVLGNLVPRRYGIGSGLVFDSEGNESNQTDIILFDAVDEPAVLAQTNQVLFPVENVRAALEVKTSVNKSEIEDIGKKVARVRALKNSSGAQPLYAAVGYQATQNLETIAMHVRALKDGGIDGLPDIFLVLDPALIGMSADIASKLGWKLREGETYLVGLAALQERDSERRVTGRYVPVPEDSDVTAIHDGGHYKIHSAPEGEYLADSARALLLFADALLTMLAHVDNRPAPGFHHYVTLQMRDLISLP